MSHTDQETVRDFLLGKSSVDWDKHAYLLNPALVQEVAMKLLIVRPTDKEAILKKLEQIERIRINAPDTVVTLPACPITDKIDAVVGCGTTDVKLRVDQANPDMLVSGAAKLAAKPASQKPSVDTGRFFSGASICRPAKRNAARTVSEVHTLEWVAVGIVCALVLAVIIMLIFFYREDPPK